MERELIADIERALGSPEEPLGRAAGILREACAVDRVSISRIDVPARRFEIAADAGAELLAPGTALPVSTCSYFARAAEGRPFSEEDFDDSRTFALPLDNVVRASGFHSGCSVPIRRDGRAVGAISCSASTRRRDVDRMVSRLETLADVLAPHVERSPGGDRTRVLICHADGLAARGIARLVELDAGARASVAPTLAQALDAAGSSPPDLVICDDWMEGLRIDEVARQLREAGVAAPLLVVSSRDAPENVRASRLAGAAGHIARRDALSSLPAALAAIRAGATLLPDPVDEGDALTSREHQLLVSLEEGLRFKQVARRFGISEATAKTHARNLFRKLGATSRAEAVHAARDRGLLA